MKHLEESIPRQNNSFEGSLQTETNRLHIINQILTYLTSLTQILFYSVDLVLRDVECRICNLFEKIWLCGGHTMTDTHYTLHITPHYCSQQNSQIIPSRGNTMLHQERRTFYNYGANQHDIDITGDYIVSNIFQFHGVIWKSFFTS